MEKGYVQIYTGDGKGKTTAALGLGLRAAGCGFKVMMFQFLKGAYSGELDSTLLLGGRFTIIRLGETKKFFGALNEQERKELKEKLQEELKQVEAILKSEACDILILDEIMAAIHGELITVQQVCKFIDARPGGMELVLTGRNAPQAIIDRADLVSEIRCVKHYMDKGVSAREGIER